MEVGHISFDSKKNAFRESLLVDKHSVFRISVLRVESQAVGIWDEATLVSCSWWPGEESSLPPGGDRRLPI